MRNDPSTVSKQSGKVATPVVVASGVTSAVLILKSTDFYQVAGHGDYVQDNGSK